MSSLQAKTYQIVNDNVTGFDKDRYCNKQYRYRTRPDITPEIREMFCDGAFAPQRGNGRTLRRKATHLICHEDITQIPCYDRYRNPQLDENLYRYPAGFREDFKVQNGWDYPDD